MFEDLFLAKYNTSGDLLWARKAGGDKPEYSSDVAIDASGNAYITGYFFGTAYFGNLSITAPASADDMFLAKYNSAGDAVWAKQANAPSAMGRSIATDASGNVYVTGEFYEKATFGSTSLTTGTSADVFVTKYNTSGDVQWARQAGGSYTDYGEAVSVDAAGYVSVMGQANRKSAVAFGTDTLSANGAARAYFLWKFKP